MKKNLSASSRNRDYLLFAFFLTAMLWGWRCADPGSPPKSYDIAKEDQHPDGGATIGAAGSVQINLGTKSSWEEAGCNVTWEVTNQGKATSAVVGEGNVLTVAGSRQEAGTHLTTITVSARTSQCEGLRLNGATDTARIPIHFE